MNGKLKSIKAFWSYISFLFLNKTRSLILCFLCNFYNERAFRGKWTFIKGETNVRFPLNELGKKSIGEISSLWLIPFYWHECDCFLYICREILWDFVYAWSQHHALLCFQHISVWLQLFHYHFSLSMEQCSLMSSEGGIFCYLPYP